MTIKSKTKFTVRLLTNSGSVRRILKIRGQSELSRFVGCLEIISAIRKVEPRSVYELSKVMKLDLANLGKTVKFLSELGAIRIKPGQLHGRRVCELIVDFDQILIPVSSTPRTELQKHRVLHTLRRTR